MVRKLVGIVVALAVVAVALPATAQAVKLGYVDLQKALTQVSEGKAAKAKLERLVKQKQAEFDKMQDDAKRLQDELSTQGSMMKDEVKRQKAQELQKKLMELQDFYLNNQKELAEEEGKVTKPILERFERILRKLGRDEGYTMIVERAAAVYAAPGIDLTDRLIKEFNAGGGKKGSDTAP